MSHNAIIHRTGIRSGIFINGFFFLSELVGNRTLFPVVCGPGLRQKKSPPRMQTTEQDLQEFVVKHAI